MYADWYRKTHPELQHSGLWLRGGELNTLEPEEYDRRLFRAMFVRLSTYFDTGYSFTHQILYQMAAGVEGVYPDLGYLPPRRDTAILDRDGIPWLLGTQSKRGPEGFDLIGFSNSIVQELINVPTLLSKSGIPLAKEERLSRPELPLVILGGANALYSSSLWLDQAVVDGIFVGENDQDIRKLLEICRDGKSQKLPKRVILDALEQVPGFFQPEKPRATRKSFALDLNRSEALEKGPVYYLEDPMGSSHLQISEGCPAFCSFCAEAWERRPYRERNAKTLKETALRLKASMGLDSIEIYSFNFNMHSELYQVLWDLVPHFRQIGLKSQRFDLLAHDPEAVKFQQVLEKTSLTCGLEGISPRIREYLNKNVEPAELHDSLTAIFKNKAREMKIFLIATGLEEEQDFVALSDLLEHIVDIRKATNSGTRVIFSMTPLVRFPWTPLEFESAYPVEHYESIIRKASGRVRAAGFEFREAADLPEYWVSQVLVRADRPEISRALRKAVERTGFVYYRDVPEEFKAALRTALAEEGLEPDALIGGFDLEESRNKPWARIETGVKREFLWERLQTLRDFKEEDYCLGRSWKKAKCFHCGACPTRFHVRNIVLSEQKRGYTLEQFKERRRKAQLAERKIDLLVEVGEAGRGLPRKMIAVALARALMLADREALTPHYRGYAGSFWSTSKDEGPVWVTGRDVVTLNWDESAIPRLRQIAGDPSMMERVNAELGRWGRWLGFAEAGWAPKRLRVDCPWEPKLDPYLKARGLKYTLRKLPDGGYGYELVAQSAKKGIMRSLVHRRPAVGSDTRDHVIELELGPKFLVSEFSDEALLSSKGSSAALARMISE